MKTVTNLRRPLIGIIGGSDCNEEEYRMAEKTGRLIAQKKAFLVCGGMSGIMEAACKGAAEVGGTTVGILPSDVISEANPYVQIPIATGMGIGRNVIIVRTVQSVIAISGGYGTLSEIAYAMQLDKPVVALRPWIRIPGIRTVQTPEEAVELALEYVK